MKGLLIQLLLPGLVLVIVYSAGYSNGKNATTEQAENRTPAVVATETPKPPEPEYTREVIDTPNGKAILRRPVKRQSPTPIQTDSAGFARSSKIAKPAAAPKDCGCNK